MGRSNRRELTPEHRVRWKNSAGASDTLVARGTQTLSGVSRRQSEFRICELDEQLCPSALISALTEKVGTGSNFSGYSSYPELADTNWNGTLSRNCESCSSGSTRRKDFNRTVDSRRQVFRSNWPVSIASHKCADSAVVPSHDNCSAAWQ